MNDEIPSIDLAEVLERWSPVIPYALMGIAFTFFSFVAIFGG